MNKYIRLLSVLLLSHQIIVAMSLMKPKPKAKPTEVRAQSSDSAAAEFQLHSEEGDPLLSEEGVVASAPSMQESLEGVVVVQQHIPVTASVATAAAAMPATTSAASLYSVLSVNQKSNAQASAATAVSSEGASTASAALNTTKQPQAIGSLVDQKKSRETIEFSVSRVKLRSLDELNDFRRAMPLLISSIKSLCPDAPLFLVEGVFNANFNKKDFSDTSVSFFAAYEHARILFAMNVYTRCIPILNSEEKLKSKIKAHYQHLTDDDIHTQAWEWLSSIAEEEIEEVREELRFSGNSDGWYEWVIRMWKRTKKSQDSDARKILEKITEIEWVPEAPTPPESPKSSVSSKSEPAASASSKSDCSIQ